MDILKKKTTKLKFQKTCLALCRITYLSSHLQCIRVLMRQLNKPYFVSNPIIQKGHDLSCCRQHRSVFEYPPKSAYFVALQPLPHHFVPGTLRKLAKSLRCLQTFSTFISPFVVIMLHSILSIEMFMYGKLERLKRITNKRNKGGTSFHSQINCV